MRKSTDLHIATLLKLLSSEPQDWKLCHWEHIFLNDDFLILLIISLPLKNKRKLSDLLHKAYVELFSLHLSYSYYSYNRLVYADKSLHNISNSREFLPMA